MKVSRGVWLELGKETIGLAMFIRMARIEAYDFYSSKLHHPRGSVPPILSVSQY